MAEGEKEYVTRKEFNIERDKFSDKLVEQGNEIAILKTLWKSLQDLPQTMQSLDKNMALMQQNLTNLNSEFKKLVEDKERRDKAQENRDNQQNQELKRIDEKSKIDLMEWVKSNWTSVVMFIAMLILFAKDFIM